MPSWAYEHAGILVVVEPVFFFSVALTYAWVEFRHELDAFSICHSDIFLARVCGIAHYDIYFYSVVLAFLDE